MTLAANATLMMSRRIGRQLDREPPSVLGQEAAEALEAVGDAGGAERKPGHSCDARDDGLSRVALEKVDYLEVADVSAAQEHPVGLPPAEPPRDWGVLLVRKGGFAVARLAGSEVVASKVGQRHVQGRTKAGGQSQQRFARRRENQARVASRAHSATRSASVQRASSLVMQMSMFRFGWLVLWQNWMCVQLAGRGRQSGSVTR